MLLQVLMLKDNLKYLGLLYGVTLEYLLYDDATDMTTSPQAAGLNKNCTEKKKLWKRNWAGITILFLLLLGVVSFLYINWGKEETIPIESLESDDGWTNADVDGFSIAWAPAGVGGGISIKCDLGLIGGGT